MYSMTGMGALPADVRAAAEVTMPGCYTNTFDECLDDANRKDPRCAKYEPMHVAFDTDYAEAKAMIDSLDYCEHGTTHLVIAGVAGGVLGLLLGAAIAA